MVWADERPIDRPRVRKARPGEVPGWRVSVDYDSGTRTETWQYWNLAVHRALVAAGPPIESVPDGLSAAERAAVLRYLAIVPVPDTHGRVEFMP
jgi:hypothetical protein